MSDIMSHAEKLCFLSSYFTGCNLDRKIIFSILFIKRGYTEPIWNAWADKWLKGEDRTSESVEAELKREFYTYRVLQPADSVYLLPSTYYHIAHTPFAEVVLHTLLGTASTHAIDQAIMLAIVASPKINLEELVEEAKKY